MIQGVNATCMKWKYKKERKGKEKEKGGGKRSSSERKLSA